MRDKCTFSLKYLDRSNDCDEISIFGACVSILTSEGERSV